MDELRKYVDSLFAHQRPDAKVQDFKEEIYSNLLAKKQDLMEQGIPEAEAVAQTKESLSSVDGFVEGSHLTYINRFQSECWQTLLLYGVILWILSIPTLLLKMASFSLLTFLIMVSFGCLYLWSKRRNQADIAFVSGARYRKVRRVGWTLWLIFFVVGTMTVTAVMFGSNIWFHRPVIITGPYEFGTLVARYYSFAVTVLLPVATGSFSGILMKHERNENDEY